MSGPMTLSQANGILGLLAFPGYAFRVLGGFTDSQPAYLQAFFKAPCSVVGGAPVLQSTRKWLLSCHMTPSELVQTAFICVLTSLEHEAREQFRYKGAAIFGPHFHVDRLAELCTQGDQALEVRQ